MSFNYQFLTALLAAIFTTALMSCGGAEERKAVYFTQGNQWFSERNFEKARLDFQNTLQIDPNHVEARFMLAKTLEELNEPKQAAGNYNRVIELDPSHINAKSRLARIYILGGAREKAKTLANEVLVSKPNDSTAMVVLATATSLDGDTEKAITLANKSLELDPANNDAVALLASIYVKQKRHADAEKLLSTAIKNSNEKSFRIILSGILIDQEKYDDAIKILTEILVEDPVNLANVTRLASLYQRIKRESDAETLLRKTVEIAPSNNEAKMLLVNYLATTKDSASAEKELLRFVESDGNNLDLKFGLAKLYNQEARYSEEVEIYKSIISTNGEGPDALKAKNALATRYLAENKVDEAKVLINQVLQKNAADNDSLVLRGMLASSEKRFDDAISDFRSVLRDQPNLVKVRKLLANAHVQNNELGLAKDNLQMILDSNKNELETRLALASVMESLNNKDESLNQIQAVLAVAPKNISALEMLYRHQFVSNDLKACEDTTNLIKKNYPDVAIGYYLSALLHTQKNNNQEAIKELTKALDKQSTAIEPLNQLVQLLLTENQPKKALEKLEDILEKHPDHLAAKNLKGEVLMSTGKESLAEKEFKSVIENNPTLATPYINLASIQLKHEELAKALEIYQQGIDKGADKTVLKLQIANVYQQSKDYDKAILVYEEILRDKPDTYLAANNLAMLLVSYKSNNESSIKRAVELVGKLKDSKNPSYLDTVGWTYYRAGDNTSALPYLNKALAIVPNDPLVLYHAGMSLYDAGEIEQAKANLEKSVESKHLFLGRNEAEETLLKISETKTRAMN